MVRDILRLDLAMILVLKTFEPSGENPYCFGCEQCRPEGFTVHVILLCDFVWFG